MKIPYHLNIIGFCQSCHKQIMEHESYSVKKKKILSHRMLIMSYFNPPITEKRYVDCILCKRFVSVGQTELLFMDGKKEVRVCAWCNHA